MRNSYLKTIKKFWRFLDRGGIFWKNVSLFAPLQQHVERLLLGLPQSQSKRLQRVCHCNRGILCFRSIILVYVRPLRLRGKNSSYGFRAYHKFLYLDPAKPCDSTAPGKSARGTIPALCLPSAPKINQRGCMRNILEFLYHPNSFA